MEEKIQKIQEDVNALNNTVTSISKDHYLIPRNKLWYWSGGFIATLLAAGILGWGAYKSLIGDKALDKRRDEAKKIVIEMDSLKQLSIDNMLYKNMPIGTIIAWHKDAELRKDMTSKDSLELPTGWQICDGEIILDDQSPFFGKDTPNLNEKEVFLRGGNKSKEPEEPILPEIKYTTSKAAHEFNPRESIFGFGTKNKNQGVYTGHVQALANVKVKEQSNILKIKYLSRDIRPRSMSVVWIMKVR